VVAEETRVELQVLAGLVKAAAALVVVVVQQEPLVFLVA
jgi:hypothetical protein